MDKVTFERLRPSACQPFVEAVIALGRGGRRERHGIDEKLLLPDDAAHQVGDLGQLTTVVAQRIYDIRAADRKLNAVAVGDGKVLVDNLDAVTRQRVDEREYRGDDVVQCVGGRQPVGAVINTDDLAFECHGHALRCLVGRHLLRIVVGHHAAAFHDGVEARILGIGKLHEAVERRLPREGVGPEAVDVSFVLPVVPLLQQGEPAAANHEVFQLHASVGFVQHGGNDYAAAAAEHLPGQ